MIEAPLDPKVEAAAALLKGAVSAIPFVGGVISEVGALYFNPLERRKQRWMIEVSKALGDVERRLAVIPAELEKDDRFISCLYQATLVALKNHQGAKLAALRNALAQSVDTLRFTEDISFQLLRYIDELTCTHLSILSSLAKSKSKLAECKALELVFACVRDALGEPLDRVAFRAFLQDLDSRFLVRIGDVEDYPEYHSTAGYVALEMSEVRPIEVTSLGLSFLSFIEA